MTAIAGTAAARIATHGHIPLYDATRGEAGSYAHRLSSGIGGKPPRADKAEWAGRPGRNTRLRGGAAGDTAEADAGTRLVPAGTTTGIEYTSARHLLRDALATRRGSLRAGEPRWTPLPGTALGGRGAWKTNATGMHAAGLSWRAGILETRQILIAVLPRIEATVPT